MREGDHVMGSFHWFDQHGGKRRRAGTAFEWTARLVLLSFVAGLVPATPGLEFAMHDAQAADPTASTDPTLNSINPGFDPTMPPQFNMASIAGQGQLFQSCSGGLQSAISQSLQSLGSLSQNQSSQNPMMAAMGMGTGINAVCPGTDVGPDADSISCENLTGANGQIDPNLFKAKQSSIQMALATIQCKKGKFQAVQGELNCLTSQADMLSQQLTAMQGAYQTNIQRMQQDMQKINQVVTDRQSQDTDVLGRLGMTTDAAGNPIPSNGSKGLLQVRDGLCLALTGAACGSTGGGDSSSGGGGGGLTSPDMRNSIPGQIQQLKDAMVAAQNTQQQLTEATNEYQMSQAADCFNNRKQPQFQCVVNGPPVSAHDYVLCMYQQKLGINSNGQVESSALTPGGILNNQNSAKEQSLSALLDQIMGDMPQGVSTPAATPGADLTSIIGSAPPASTILTAADVEAQYGSQLEGFNTANDPIHDFVMKNVSYCFQRAQNAVNQQKGMASSEIGKQQAALTQAQDDLKTQANTVLSGNVSKYEEAMTALTGMNMPLNTSKCTNATPDVQVSCLQDLQQNMEALLHGSSANSTVQMTINGTQAATNIAFTCQGLDGCITALQNVDRNLKTEVKRVGQFKQQYVTAAKQSVDNFTKQMASMMSAQSSALNNRLKQLNSALASLGVGQGINIPPVACEDPQFDADGLPMPPQSALKFIGCKMNPPMMDVSGNDFSSALSGVADGQTQLNDKLGPLNDAMNKLMAMQGQCMGKVMQRKLTQAQTDSDAISSGNCQYSEQFCNQSSSVSDLMSSVSGMDGVSMSSDAISSVSSSLEAGMDACAQAQPQRKQLANYQACVVRQQAQPNPLPDGTQAIVCSPPVGLAVPSASCSSIVTRLRRDLANVGGSSNSTGGSSASGAQ